MFNPAPAIKQLFYRVTRHPEKFGLGKFMLATPAKQLPAPVNFHRAAFAALRIKKLEQGIEHAAKSVLRTCRD
jgi:protein-S-isoprenylcysteine O-methyltransferase Ste14